MRHVARGEGERADANRPHLRVSRAQGKRNQARVLRAERRRSAHVEIAVDDDHIDALADHRKGRLCAFRAV